MSFKSKLTLMISAVVFLFLTITVILNDYSTRVNKKADAETNMVQFSNQIAGSVEQHIRLKDALKNDVILQLHGTIEAVSRTLPLSLEEVRSEELVETAERLQLAHVTLLVYDEGGFIARESTRPALVGKPIPVDLTPASLLESFRTVEADANMFERFYAVYWDAVPELESNEEMWGFVRLPNRDYVLAAAFSMGKDIQLLDLTGPETIIHDVLKLHPEIMEIAVIRPEAFRTGEALIASGLGSDDANRPILFGSYSWRNAASDGQDIARAAAGQQIFRQTHIRGLPVTVSTVGFESEESIVVRAVMNHNYLHHVIKEDRINQFAIYGAVLLIAVLTSFWLSGVMLRPIQSILAKVNEVAAGRFDTPLVVDRRDEIGQLAERVNFMAKNLDVYTAKLKTAFEENRSMKEYLESIINHTTDAIHIEDTEGTIVQMNHAFEQLFGWTTEEAIGHRLPLIPDSYLKEERDAYGQLLAGQQLPARETIRRRKDGSWFEVSVTTSAIRDRNGIIQAFASITRDMTNRNKMDELLRRAEKLNTVGQLAAGVAHEIRNPLTTLRGFLQLQQQTNALNLRHTDLMLSELDRINLIVGEFLILAKPQATKFQIKDVRFVLGDVISLLDSQAHLCNVQFATEFASEPCEIACEENQLKQVFINVLKNALEAMPKGGDITIVVSKPVPESIVVAIRDQGVGIPEEMISKLGDPFLTSKETGTGLGIMVSQRIIQSHQGTMEIRSTEGEGTVVTITLPALID